MEDKRRDLGLWLRRGLMVLSVGLLIRMGVTHLPEIQDALAQLLTRSGWLVAAALALEFGWLVSLSNVYRSSIRGFGGDLGRWQALRISMGAFSLSRILPGGGAAGSVFAARAIVAQGNQVPKTVASMLVAWWVSMTTLTLVVGVGTATGIPGGDAGVAHLLGPATVLGALLLLGAIVLIALRRPGIRTRVVTALSRAGSRLGVIASRQDWESQTTTTVRLWSLSPLLGWATLSWVVDAAALWVMFLGFGVRLHPAVLLVGYGLANLINALPELTPGWIGLLETTLAATYAALGVPAGVAVVAVLCYRLVSYWLPVAAGIGPGLQMLRARSGTTATAQPDLELETAA